MNSFQGMRVIENVNLTEAGPETDGWFPLGRSGWKVKRRYTPQVPYRGAIRLNANTLVMHPAVLREMRETLKGEAPR